MTQSGHFLFRYNDHRGAQNCVAEHISSLHFLDNGVRFCVVGGDNLDCVMKLWVQYLAHRFNFCNSNLCKRRFNRAGH